MLVLTVEFPVPALAVPTQPPIDFSYYLTSSDTTGHAMSLGCNVASADIAHGRNSEVILDFGAQTSDGTGTKLTTGSVIWSNATDEVYATSFSQGYQGCNQGNHTLFLAVGTNNSGSNVGASNGGVWGRVVQAVANWDSSHTYTSVTVRGANDIESFGTYAAFNNWENGSGGYTAYTSALLADYGSADGCSQTPGHYQNQTCTGDWTTSANYNAAWFFKPNLAVPEIYYPGGINCDGLIDPANQSVQWADISMFGVYAGQTKILFEGPLWDGSSCFSSSSAEWSAFWNALNADGVAMTPYYQLQITTN